MIGRCQDGGVHSQITTVVTRLELNNGQCLHTNSVKVVCLEDQADFSEPTVVSSLTEQNDNQIIRRTEVRYLKKKYIVQDVYRFDYSPGTGETGEGNSASISSSDDRNRQDEQAFKRENSKDANRYKKVCIFHKKNQNGKTLTKRNTKNLPKNFFKGFLGFMQCRNKTQDYDEIVHLLINLKKGMLYNNMLIQKILSCTKIAPYFHDFLENNAEQWIKTSKISDKQVHLEAIPIYLSLISRYDYAEGSIDSSDI